MGPKPRPYSSLKERAELMKESMGRIIFILAMPWVLYLVVDALRSKAIIIKGRGDALGGWGRRVYREESPLTYWFFLCFYLGGIALMSYALWGVDL